MSGNRDSWFRTLRGAAASLLLGAGACMAASEPTSGQQYPLPDRLESIAPGTWGVISDNTLADVVACRQRNCSYSGNSGPASILTAWNGGALATRLGALGSLIAWGGGHNDYWGSDSYAFDIETGLWRQLTPPYEGRLSWPYESATYPDGSPIPNHTYDYIEYHEPSNSIVVMTGTPDPRSGTSYRSVAHRLALDTLSWSTTRNPQASGITVGGIACVAGDEVWAQGADTGARIVSYDVVKDEFTAHGVTPHGGFGKNGNAECIDGAMIWSSFNGPAKRIFRMDLDRPQLRITVNQAGDPPERRPANGWAWSTLRESFIYYHPSDRERVYEFQMTGRSEGIWRPISMPVQPVTKPATDGRLFSKGRVARYGNSEFLLVWHQINEPVWAFRIPEGPVAVAEAVPEPVTNALDGQSWEPMDFARRCRLPGVLFCHSFDSEREVSRYAIGRDQPGGAYTIPELDSEVSYSGSGSMRFTIPPYSRPDASGYWMRALGTELGEGDALYLQFKIRVDRFMLEHDFPHTGGGGAMPKIFIIHPQGPSCATPQFVLYMSGRNVGTKWPAMYSNCGSHNMHFSYPAELQPDKTPLNWWYQQGDWNCQRYRAFTFAGADLSDCFTFPPDEWVTIYMAMRLGRDGQPDSHIVVFGGYEGGPLRKFVDTNAGLTQWSQALPSRDNSRKPLAFLQFTPYLTGKDPTENHRTTWMWIDDVIVATRPINPPLENPVDSVHGRSPAGVAEPPPGYPPGLSLKGRH